jgi:hypothetical protein
VANRITRPQEYLRELQSRYNLYPRLLAARDRFEKMLGGYDERPSDSLTKLASQPDWISLDYTYTVLALSNYPRIPSCLTDPNYLAVGELKSANVNGSAIPVPNYDGWGATYDVPFW